MMANYLNDDENFIEMSNRENVWTEISQKPSYESFMFKIILNFLFLLDGTKRTYDQWKVKTCSSCWLK